MKQANSGSLERRLTDDERVRIATTMETLVVAAHRGEITRQAMLVGMGCTLETASLLTGLPVAEIEKLVIPLTKERLAS